MRTPWNRSGASISSWSEPMPSPARITTLLASGGPHSSSFDTLPSALLPSTVTRMVWVAAS